MKLFWSIATIAVIVLMTLVSSGRPAQRASEPRSEVAAPVGAERRFDIAAPPTTDVVSMAISPDGRKMVFVANAEGHNGLWVRDLNSGAPDRPLRETGNSAVSVPFWSPDSRSVGFFSDRECRRVDVETGQVQTIFRTGPAPNLGATWNKDGTILFANVGGKEILRIDASGPTFSKGSRVAVTRLQAPAQAQHSTPHFLPDGRHFLYYAVGSEKVRGVWVGQIDGPETKRLMDADAGAIFAPPGQILFVHQGILFGQAFDPRTLELGGTPFQIAANVPVLFYAAAVSASAAGTIAYRSGAGTQLAVGPDSRPLPIQVNVADAVGKRFTWFDRSGKELGTIPAPALDLAPSAPSLSPDGRTVAFGRTQDGNTDIWLLDVKNGDLNRFTSDSARESYPVWSPDNRRIAFSSNRGDGVLKPYVKPLRDDAQETLMSTQTVQGHISPADWSSDGRFVLLGGAGPGLRSLQLDSGIWNFILEASSSFSILNAQFSPDGKWVALQSDATSRTEIYLAPFVPNTKGNLISSSGGGVWPRWRRDGKELYYVAPDGMLMAVPITDISTGRAGSPVPLFRTPMVRDYSTNRTQYMVSEDGRFLMITPQEVQAPIHVIANWTPPAP